MPSHAKSKTKSHKNHAHKSRAFKRSSVAQKTCLIFGLHSVSAALQNPNRVCKQLQVTQNALQKLEKVLSSSSVAVEIVESRDLDRQLGADVIHQGVLLKADFLDILDLEDLHPSSHSRVLVLDQITDPHNVGAILRTAAAFETQALVMTQRHSPQLSGVLAKTASGGLEHVPICLVSNLARALEQLGKKEYWRIGLDSDAEINLEDQDLERPVALVLGAEHKGIRRLTQENCDQICKIKTAGALKSLNVSNAAAIALHTTYCAS
ncbi:MAG: 23S rRNA (guanosine(2251)-2'-O)-methyltransferase RlmB [Pseudomonadota bacterium]